MVVPPQRVLLQRALPLLQAQQQLQQLLAQRAVPLLLALPPPQRGAAQRPPGPVVWRGERRVWEGARTWRASSHPGRD